MTTVCCLLFVSVESIASSIFIYSPCGGEETASCFKRRFEIKGHTPSCISSRVQRHGSGVRGEFKAVGVPGYGSCVACSRDESPEISAPVYAVYVISRDIFGSDKPTAVLKHHIDRTCVLVYGLMSGRCISQILQQ